PAGTSRARVSVAVNLLCVSPAEVRPGWGQGQGRNLADRRFLMNARPASISASICLLAALSGCAFTEHAVHSAFGTSGGQEQAEQARLIRAERASGLSDEQIESRIAFVSERLDENRLHAAAWKYGWLVVNGGGMIAAATQAAVTHKLGSD